MNIILPERNITPEICVYIGSEKGKVLYMNTESVRVTGLKAGDNILFGQDEKDECIFYLFKTEKGKGFKTQQTQSKALMCNCVKFAKLLIETLKPKGKKIVFTMSPKTSVVDGIEVYRMMQIREEDML